MRILPEILESTPSIAEIRRSIHAHPELRFEEKRTADLVAQALSSWGIAVYQGLGKTGVVGRLDGELGPGKMIGLRADMDALPLQEKNTFAHASQNPGKMHACGHDGHTAMLLGAAQYLSNHRDFKGTVMFIFQPAEEGGAGAQEMIEDGLFEQFPCDAVFGMHNWPGLEEGHFGVVSGPMMASSNEFVIDIQGKGGHAALPHNSADPIMAGLISVPAAGKYTFFIASDDGSRIYLDNKLLIDNDGLHGMVEKQATVQLTAGAHPIVVTYFDNGGGDGLSVDWSGPGIERKKIAAKYISVSGGAETIHDVAVRKMESIPGHEEEKF
ncbi:MAG: amidohydrolase, partial [Polynucleobacter sp.]